QFLSHFTLGGVNWAQPLSTWSIHKVPDVTPRELTRLGFTGDTTRLSEEVVAMPNLHSLYKCNHGAREGVVIADLPYFRLVEG
ncbi:MAG TPA: hypothetical protein VMM59_05690, partial [Thermohalobaculum sp.]|nr:hypothetical protein [Thermohalobaculum sp.]